MKANKKCCENEQLCAPQPIFLSQETTAEILGDTLGVLIAIGKNGQQIQFLPYAGNNEQEQQSCHSSAQTEPLEISLTLQKHQEISQKILRFVKKSAKRSYIVATHCLCKLGGKEWRC